jgi:hypothetical protein
MQLGELNRLAAEYLGGEYDVDFYINGQNQIVWNSSVENPPTAEQIEQAWLPARRHQRKEDARTEASTYISTAIAPVTMELAALGPPAITAAQQEQIQLFVRDTWAAVNDFDDLIDAADLAGIGGPAVDWPAFEDYAS